MVQDAPRVTISRNKLLINNATVGDSGSYSCSATTRDSSVTKTASSPLSVTVVGKYLSYDLCLIHPSPFY